MNTAYKLRRISVIYGTTVDIGMDQEPSIYLPLAAH